MAFDVKTKFAEIKKRMEESSTINFFHGCVIGEKGVGKTSLAKTCPAPVLIHSFDSGGTVTLRKEIKEGKIFVDTRFEEDDRVHPTAYSLWEKEYHELGNNGFFNSLGTYILDSTTTFCDALIRQIMHKEGRSPSNMSSKSGEGQGMRIQDWMTLYHQMTNVVISLSALPCHTLILGHLERDKDEALGNIIKKLMLPGQSGERLPVHFQEYYTLINKESSSGSERVFITENFSEYRAATRIGSGIFSREEKPDIRYLIKKAGLNADDKV